MKHRILLSALAIVAISVCARGQGQKIMTFAGNGVAGYAGDGFSAGGANLWGPTDVAVDKYGNVYILDFNNYKIRRVATNNIITTVAGTGIPGNSGNGSLATTANIAPQGMAVDLRSNIFFSYKGGGVIRRVNAYGFISRYAGGGLNGLQYGYSGDGGKADTARFNQPAGIAVDDTGNLFIADAGNNVIRRIDTFGFVSTVAGSGVSGYTGDGGDATAATLDSPYTVAVDRKGNIYINDFKNNVIRKVDAATKVITTFVGTGASGLSGDNGPASAATLSQARGLATDTVGNLYIADANNSVIRKVDTSASAIITSVAGNGTYGYGGDFSYAIGANLNNPYGVAVDKYGSIYIGDANNQRVRKTYALTAVPGLVNVEQQVYPNPFINTISIQGLAVSDKVAISDMAGRQVSEVWEVKTTGMQTFSAAHLATGIYMLQVWDNAGNKKSVTKLVKE